MHSTNTSGKYPRHWWMLEIECELDTQVSALREVPTDRYNRVKLLAFFEAQASPYILIYFIEFWWRLYEIMWSV